MISSKNKSSDQFEGIYFHDYLKKDKSKHSNIKNVIKYIFYHVLLIGLGIAIYTLVNSDILPNTSTKSTKTSEKSKEVTESCSLVISQTAVKLNIDYDETAEVKNYDKSYKEQAIKIAKEIGNKKASNELGVPYKF